MGRVLPRHMQLIEQIDAHHANLVTRPASVRVVDGNEVRMGTLALIGARRVNGVSALHTDPMKKPVFTDLPAPTPERLVIPVRPAGGAKRCEDREIIAAV